jgi:site-specific DNA-methyltransferase (adenine-specific)
MIELQMPPFCQTDVVGSPSSIVYNMDCFEGMKHYPDKYFDLALVDPPYGIGLASNPFRQKQEKKNWDMSIPEMEYFEQLFRVSKNQIIWGGNYFDLPKSQGFLIWDKKQPYDFSSAMCEFAWSSIQKPAKIYSKHVVTAEPNKIHPTQKPVSLYEFCLKFSELEAGANILDTHLGSGSSRIACYRNGFEFVGFEIDKKYCQTMDKRFKDAISQQRLF